jgi:hypothetical protein
MAAVDSGHSAGSHVATVFFTQNQRVLYASSLARPAAICGGGWEIKAQPPPRSAASQELKPPPMPVVISIGATSELRAAPA